MSDKQSAASEGTTHFGYEEVDVKEKAHRVAGVFDSVAKNYDIMNDVMSMGLHRIWKKVALDTSGVRAGHRVLDLASGTGDLAARFSAMVGAQGKVVASDINPNMLKVGRERLTDRGIVGNIEYVQADAEALPFPDNYFNFASISFGLRNVTHKEAALASLYRVLKPGGRLMVLEFSKPLEALKPIYDTYSFKLLPLMGRLIANDEDSYRYLAESIRMHPDQETLKGMMAEAGFERCEFMNMSGGIVALHKGYKF
ncbi:MAG TPA: bifunctional demethylmenaquinone methyltransferase/2-methoxy-6-polyprenyl-1,4-benzoquinol methylase UbiE [Chromatiales bacterium]|nr:bifunctional demethylmenaquinone methyltransferase/2-methoxy-6-polyprenyl-1,4-benzoquinol methylase UbiE [Chromatiales bacterium]